MYNLKFFRKTVNSKNCMFGKDFHRFVHLGERTSLSAECYFSIPPDSLQGSETRPEAKHASLI